MNSNWSYSPETPNLGQIRCFLELCDLEIWRMTLKNNRASLLSIIKLYASFHYHMWIQTGVTVRKWLSWVLTSVTLTFDLWPWTFAWTLLWSLVIIPENFMMIGWWEHCQKGVTDRRTDRQTDRQTGRQTDRQTEIAILKAAWSQLKITIDIRENAPGNVVCKIIAILFRPLRVKMILTCMADDNTKVQFVEWINFAHSNIRIMMTS